MSSLSGLKILVAEDDPSLLTIQTLILKQRGATVFEALNGKKALEIMSREQVDLVLSDIQMPVVDGLELLAEIRRVKPTLPIVLFITGQAKVNEAQSLDLGASGLLIKPVKLSDLINRIEALMSAGTLVKAAA